jgi:hypothetical protein
VDFEVRKKQDLERQWAESRPILRSIGLVLLAVGFFLLVNGLYAGVQKYKRIGQWAPVDAKVLDFKVVNEATGRVNNGYRAHFTFEYEVQGRKLVGWAHVGEGSMISIDPGSKSRNRTLRTCGFSLSVTSNPEVTPR